MLKLHYILSLFVAIVLLSCNSGKKQQDYTPWGEPIDENGSPLNSEGDTLSKNGKGFTLKDIKDAGEMIMLVVSSPETYYEYHGHGMGLQYLICEKFAEKIGVSLRVDMCSDSAEVVRRLKAGEGDIAVFSDFKYWMVGDNASELSKELHSWYTPQILEQTRKDMKRVLSYGVVKRRVYPFMLNRQTGTISKYDQLFQKYASVAHVEWTLLAAQCYQESCFDPQAKSWVGACGLMQIMPSTADYLGLAREDMFKPDENIYAAARYLADLQNKFSDIPSRQERLNFSLAAYNGGMAHVRDAMALTKKYGGNHQRWADVKQYILKLMEPAYYRDPVVKNGYMRGTETSAYVDKIMERWDVYRGATHGRSSLDYSQPQRATKPRKAKYE